MKEKKKKTNMVNITINIPDIYDENLQKLIKMKVIPSRSGGIRLALRDFLINQYQELKILGYIENKLNQNSNLTKKENVKQEKKKIEWNTQEIEQLNKELSEKL